LADQHPIDDLFSLIAERRKADPARSYTAKLLRQGASKCAKKLGEEAVEAALAAVSETKARLAEESADVLYHLLVLWVACGVQPKDVYKILQERQGRSGLDDKAARKAGQAPARRVRPARPRVR
jgi:phosphoribosyl-ATP pyrophosphohydrolase